MERNQHFLKAKKYLIRLWRSSPKISVKWLNLHGMSPSVYGKWYVERMQPCQAQWFKQTFYLCFWIYIPVIHLNSFKFHRGDSRHFKQEHIPIMSMNVKRCPRWETKRNEKLNWENRRLQCCSTLPAEMESSLGGELGTAHLYQ